MTAYYNEFKPEAAHMLRQLIKDGLIAPGDVDERPIQEVKADDIKGYTQCHFFAGIGGWSVALRLAGWDDTRSVWTGSCPCQPFSAAGKKAKQSDERHLWPDWFRLIRESKPSVVFGEQVANAIAHGWWDDVAADLETEKYACAAAVLGACSVGNPHKRYRLWFVANTIMCNNFQSQRCINGEAESLAEIIGPANSSSGKSSRTGNINVGDAAGQRCGEARESWPGCSKRIANASTASNVADTVSERRCSGDGERQDADNAYSPSETCEWIECPDGKARPVEPSIRLLADGVQHRAPVLHAFGNAIVPAVAQAFIEATGLV